MLCQRGLLFLSVLSDAQAFQLFNWFRHDCSKPRNETNTFDHALKLSQATSMFTRAGASRPKGLPVECPSKFTEHDIDWINMVPYDWKKSHTGKNITFITKDTAVAAVGGVIDHNANALDRSVGYMALAGDHKTWSFDLHSFDFFCVDRNHKAVDCEIGVLTTHGLGFDDCDVSKMQVAKFTAKGRGDRAQPFVLDNDRKSNYLKLVAIGHPEAVWKKHLAGEPSSWNLTVIDDTLDENQNHITVFVDNFQFATHCNKKKKIPKRPYGDVLKKYVYTMEGRWCEEPKIA